MAGEVTALDTSRAGRRIIERPRLTRLLSESESRVMLLVAPAGYGKTTLARQWLRDRKHAWYQATPASSDVAALAVGLARAAESVVQGIADPLLAQINSTRDPEGATDVVAAQLASLLSAWPANARFVIDDYHVLRDSQSAEKLIEELVMATSVPFLIASRDRPPWVTAKKLLYGEVRELGRTALAMSHDEAAAALAHTHDEMPGLVSLAEGWPAVIGLAALITEPMQPNEHEIPETLHEFFAEELYQELDDDLKWALTRLALAPSIDDRIVRTVFDDAAGPLLARGDRCGFLARSRHGHEMHPLLRQFLRTKVEEFDDAVVTETAESFARAYMAHSLWDEAASIAEDFGLGGIVLEVLQGGLEGALSEGRVTTVKRWVDSARLIDPAASVIRLADIELAFRAGNVSAARESARQLASATAEDDAFASRIYLRAGQISHLDDRLDEALMLFTRARDSAREPADLRHALWSQFVSLTDHDDREGAAAALTALEKLASVRVEDLLRASQARLQWALRWGGVIGAIDAAATALETVDRSTDPVVRTGFLQTYGVALILAARYAEAAAIAQRELEEAERFKLDWVLPHAVEMQASAAVGQRDFTNALRMLSRVRDLAAGNAHFELNVDVLRARVYLCSGAPERSVELLDGRDSAATNPGMRGDYLATLGIALICAGRVSEGSALLDDAEEVTTHTEARTLGAFGRAIVSHFSDRGGLDEAVLRKACGVATETGNFDAFVTAYRACPPILRPLADLDDTDVFISIAQQTDTALAEACGIRARVIERRTGEILTRREREVLELVSQGLSNRQIARTLWIAESTVKVHIHHVLEKLGVQSRTEAAAKAADVL